MGDDMVSIGMVVGLDHRDTALSTHDLLQELKTHPRIRQILDGGERLEWGGKTIPEGGFVALPRRLHAPGLLLCGDGAGLVNVPALKGIHYAVESRGPPGGRGGGAPGGGGAGPPRPGGGRGFPDAPGGACLVGGARGRGPTWG